MYMKVGLREDQLKLDTHVLSLVGSTIRRMSSLQAYLLKLLKKNEITQQQYDEMRPRNARPARAHGLPKIHKNFTNLPKFRPIIDTTGTTQALVGKFVTNFLKPLTTNEFTVKDSFEAAERIKNIDNTLFQNGFTFVSFDVETLFTNVHIKRTIALIMKRIYDENLLPTNLSKRTLKKLINDTCTKTAFTFNNQFYEQTDGVSMGSSLGPVLANIIMTEVENVVIRPLIEQGLIKFYSRYVDDTLLLVKKTGLMFIHERLNNFDSNLRFTVDLFDDTLPHFLDLELHEDGVSIYRKNTNTGLYVNFDSYVPWHYRIAWIRSLVSRATKICSSDKLNNEINNVKKFASWNGFPRQIVEKIVNNTQSNSVSPVSTINDSITVYFRMPFCGSKGQSIFRSCVLKIKRHLKKGKVVKFKLLNDITKIGMYCNVKDSTPMLCRSNLVYKFQCPGCCSSYIGKTERTLFERLNEHGWYDKNSAIFQHLLNCEDISFLQNLMCFGISALSRNEKKSHFINIVRNNTHIIDTSPNWNILSFKEALKIKEFLPSLNVGLKASKELQLFS